MLYYPDTLVAICYGPTMRKSETTREMVVSEKVIRSSPSFIHLILSFFSLFVYVLLALLALVHHYGDEIMCSVHSLHSYNLYTCIYRYRRTVL
jgi:hypothetical protein